MTANNPQLPWTDEQWTRVNQVVQEEARRARVAASFLPLVGPLPGGTDFVRAEIISYPDVERSETITHSDGRSETVTVRSTPNTEKIKVDDRTTIQLATLQVKVELRGAQMADPEMRTALAMFRRAANVLARLEDAVVFQGLKAADASGSIEPKGGVKGLPEIWEIHGGKEERPGLWQPPGTPTWQWIAVDNTGQVLVAAVSDAIGKLEGQGQFGPFAVVLGQGLFLIAQTPDQDGYVLPQDRIIPFLGGGSILRSSTLGDDSGGYTGVVVALGSSPIELVVATDMSLQFLQVTQEPRYLFRVRERIALRIKEADAVVRLYYESDPPTVTAVTPNTGPSVGGGRPIIIKGTNLLGTETLELDGTNATDFSVQSDTRIRMTLPPRGQNTPANQVVHVRVTTPGGTSATSGNDQFTFTEPTVTAVNPNYGPSAGGGNVVITGTQLLRATKVELDGTNAPNFTVNSDTSITMVLPQRGQNTPANQPVRVRVTAPSGTSAATQNDQFTYAEPPMVTAVNPSNGPNTGGGNVTITGSYLLGATRVELDGTNAPNFRVNSDTSITMVLPRRNQNTPLNQPVHVRVTTQSGTSAATPNDQFTYN